MTEKRNRSDRSATKGVSSAMPAPHLVEGGAASSCASSSSSIPCHKVGRDLMYDRYAAAYDEHMSYHDCTSQLLPILTRIIADRHRAADAPAVAPPLAATPPPLIADGEERSDVAAPQDDPRDNEAAESELSPRIPSRSRTSVAHQPNRWHGAAPPLTLFDVGCGTGRMATLLAPLFGRIVAVDRAEGMLQVCREKLAACGCTVAPDQPLHYHHGHGDAAALGRDDGGAPCMTIVGDASSVRTVEGRDDNDCRAATRTAVVFRASFEDLVRVRQGMRTAEEGGRSPSADGGGKPAELPTNNDNADVGATGRVASDDVTAARTVDVLSSAVVVAVNRSPSDSRERISDAAADAVLRDVLRTRCVDVVTCGWSLSSVMNAQWGVDRWHESVRQTLAALEATIHTRRGGVVIIVETLGKLQPLPSRRSTLHTFFENSGYASEWCHTDYRFPSMDVGRRSVMFFFGQGLLERYEAAGEATLLECTGVWYKKVLPRDSE